jgi:HAD superfamily hydrolase (TIGR01490 family)
MSRDDARFARPAEQRPSTTRTASSPQPVRHHRQPPDRLLHEDPAERRPPTARASAAFFDLDKTILARSSTLAFSRPFYREGLINKRTVLRSVYAQSVYLLSGADHDQMERIRAHLSQLVAGWDVQLVKDIVATTLRHVVEPLVYAEAVALIKEHQAAGRDVVIVSSSGLEVVEPIGAMLGADHVIATRMDVADGHYTGDIDFYCYGPNKVVGIRELALRRDYDLTECYAYSDSATDLPMLEAVGHPFAVNPDRALRRVAKERGWPVLRFSQPMVVPERRRLPVNRPVLTAAALGVAVALVWAVRRGRSATSSVDDATALAQAARSAVVGKGKDLGQALSFGWRAS